MGAVLSPRCSAMRASRPDDVVVEVRNTGGAPLDAAAAWLATQCSKKAITELMRIAWRTVGSIIARVWADTASGIGALAGLTRIGIDEISYKRGHKYLTVVVDHDTGRLVWAYPGRDRSTVRAFFDALEKSGEGRCARITHVTADGALWISDVVRDRCPGAIRCADPFHVVGWATEALDAVRRQAWSDARRGNTRPHGWINGRRSTVSTGPARALLRSRYALWKNPENLTDRQRVKLRWIASIHRSTSLSRVPAQRRAPHCLQAPRRPGRRSTRSLGSVGTTKPYRFFRQPPKTRRRPPCTDTRCH